MKGWENLYMGGLNNKGLRRRLTSVYKTRTTNPIEFTRTDRGLVTVKFVTERKNDQRGSESKCRPGWATLIKGGRLVQILPPTATAPWTCHSSCSTSSSQRCLCTSNDSFSITAALLRNTINRQAEAVCGQGQASCVEQNMYLEISTGRGSTGVLKFILNQACTKNNSSIVCGDLLCSDRAMWPWEILRSEVFLNLEIRISRQKVKHI